MLKLTAFVGACVFVLGSGVALGQEPAPPGSIGNCVTNAHTLCLNNDRFAVTARFRTTSSARDGRDGRRADRRLRLLLVFQSREHRGRHQGPQRLRPHPALLGLRDRPDERRGHALRHRHGEPTRSRRTPITLGVPFAPIQDTTAFACP